MKNFFARVYAWLVEHAEALTPEPTGYVSWYCDARPYMDERQYLCKYPTGEGYWYSKLLVNAYRFSTYEEAKAATPVYDGSGGIENRTGVMAVYN